MSSESRRASFGELIDQGILQIGDGYRAKNDELGGDGLIFLRSAHVRDSHIDFAGVERFHVGTEAKLKQKLSAPGDVMVTTKGNSTGRTGFVTAQMPVFVYSPHLSFWRSLDHRELAPGFLRAWSDSDDFRNQLRSMCYSTDMAPYLSLTDQRRLTIALPPIRTQASIAALDQAINKRITLLRETNATLEAIAQALFKSWFVDFDPVHAKQQGRTPEGMDEATAALFPDSFEESELGLVPKGWVVGKLEDMLVLQRGFDLPSSDRVPGDYPIIAASGPAGTHKTAMAKAPGVVTGRSGVLGKVYLELEDYWPLNTTLWVKEFRAASPCYAYEVLSLLDFASFNAGSAVPTLNRNHVHSLPYLIPSRACIDAYESIAMRLHARVRENQHQAQTLATLRDILLPRLISGQLRLPEVEAIIADSMA